MIKNYILHIILHISILPRNSTFMVYSIGHYGRNALNHLCKYFYDMCIKSIVIYVCKRFV